MEYLGGCLCGRVRYRAAGTPLWQGHCHCRLCQRNSGAAFLSFLLFSSCDLTWTGARPQVWHSSDEVGRGFCPTCGSVISFERPARRRIAVTAGSLDTPGLLVPTEHMFTSQQCPWLRLDDGLPGYARFPPFLHDIGPE